MDDVLEKRVFVWGVQLRERAHQHVFVVLWFLLLVGVEAVVDVVQKRRHFVDEKPHLFVHMRDRILLSYVYFLDRLHDFSLVGDVHFLGNVEHELVCVQKVVHFVADDDGSVHVLLMRLVAGNAEQKLFEVGVVHEEDDLVSVEYRVERVIV